MRARFCVSVPVLVFKLITHLHRRVRINYRPRRKMKKAERHWVTIENSAGLSRNDVLARGLPGPSIKSWLEKRHNPSTRRKRKLSQPKLKHRRLGTSSSFTFSPVVTSKHHTHESVGFVCVTINCFAELTLLICTSVDNSSQSPQPRRHQTL